MCVCVCVVCVCGVCVCVACVNVCVCVCVWVGVCARGRVRVHCVHVLFQTLKKQKDPAHMSVLKTRRCFLWNCQYFQLDIFREPCTERYVCNTAS